MMLYKSQILHWVRRDGKVIRDGQQVRTLKEEDMAFFQKD
jgi:hypothetical protein